MYLKGSAVLLGLVMLTFFALALPTASTSANDESEFKPFVLGAGEGESIAFPPHPTFRLADPGSNIAGMSFFEIVIDANSAGAPPHTHAHEDEFFYVREGTVTFMANGDRKTIGPGGFVMLPRHSLHAVWNASKTNAILLVGTSQGRFGDFFDAVAIEVRAQDAKTPQQVGAIIDRLGSERGVVVDMSKVPPDVAALYGL